MRLLGFAFLVLLAGCSASGDYPQGVAPAPKMREVIWDMLRADEAVSFYLPADSVMQVPEKYVRNYPAILQRHGLTKQQFRQSMQFYQQRPDLFRTIVDSLQKRVEKQMQSPPSHKVKRS